MIPSAKCCNSEFVPFGIRLYWYQKLGCARRISSNIKGLSLDWSPAASLSCDKRRRLTHAMQPGDAVEFMSAACEGNVNIVDKFLQDGGNPNVHDEMKRTALHRASLRGHTEVVETLLKYGADINFKDQLGSQAAHWACRGGSLDVIKALRRHGADLNGRDKLCSTPLHVATRTGQVDIVEHLLSCDVKINYKDREGDTALHDAVRLNRYKIVKLLLVAGADTKIKNHEGITAAEQAKHWQIDVMETLRSPETMKEATVDSESRERSD